MFHGSIYSFRNSDLGSWLLILFFRYTKVLWSHLYDEEAWRKQILLGCAIKLSNRVRFSLLIYLSTKLFLSFNWCFFFFSVRLFLSVAYLKWISLAFELLLQSTTFLIWSTERILKCGSISWSYKLKAFWVLYRWTRNGFETGSTLIIFASSLLLIIDELSEPLINWVTLIVPPKNFSQKELKFGFISLLNSFFILSLLISNIFLSLIEWWKFSLYSNEYIEILIKINWWLFGLCSSSGCYWNPVIGFFWGLGINSHCGQDFAEIASQPHYDYTQASRS